MRIAYYALGGGLGHLTRALAVLRHLRPLVPDEGVLLLTSSAYAHLAIQAGVPVMRVPGAAEAALFPKGAVAALVGALLARLAPIDLLVVDTFADGLHVELTPEVRALARRTALVHRPGGPIAIDQTPAMPFPGYDRVLVAAPTTELPGAEPVGWIVQRQAHEAHAPADARAWLGVTPDDRRPLVLGLHAGEPGEVEAFFAQLRAGCARLARPHVLRLATPLPLAGRPRPEVVHPYPAAEAFPGVDLLVSGAGYNSAAEACAFGLRAVYRPFGRSHDDQAARAAEAPFQLAPLDGPAEVAAVLAAALDAPRPTPTPPDETNGAERAARALAKLLHDG